jgi:hypothetical protein
MRARTLTGSPRRPQSDVCFPTDCGIEGIHGGLALLCSVASRSDTQWKAISRIYEFGISPWVSRGLLRSIWTTNLDIT